MLKTEVYNVTPRLDEMHLQCQHLIQALQKEDARFEMLQNKIIAYETSKVDTSAYHEADLNMKHMLTNFDRRLEEMNDSQKSLQNWVEKYEPLKVQHQITDTIS